MQQRSSLKPTKPFSADDVKAILALEIGSPTEEPGLSAILSVMGSFSSGCMVQDISHSIPKEFWGERKEMNARISAGLEKLASQNKVKPLHDRWFLGQAIVLSTTTEPIKNARGKKIGAIEVQVIVRHDWLEVKGQATLTSPADAKPIPRYTKNIDRNAKQNDITAAVAAVVETLGKMVRSSLAPPGTPAGVAAAVPAPAAPPSPEIPAALTPVKALSSARYVADVTPVVLSAAANLSKPAKVASKPSKPSKPSRKKAAAKVEPVAESTQAAAPVVEPVAEAVAEPAVPEPKKEEPAKSVSAAAPDSSISIPVIEPVDKKPSALEQCLAIVRNAYPTPPVLSDSEADRDAVVEWLDHHGLIDMAKWTETKGSWHEAWRTCENIDHMLDTVYFSMMYRSYGSPERRKLAGVAADCAALASHLMSDAARACVLLVKSYADGVNMDVNSICDATEAIPMSSVVADHAASAAGRAATIYNPHRGAAYAVGFACKALEADEARAGHQGPRENTRPVFWCLPSEALPSAWKVDETKADDSLNPDLPKKGLANRPFGSSPGVDCADCGVAATIMYAQEFGGDIWSCPSCGASAPACAATFGRKSCQLLLGHPAKQPHVSASGSTWPCEEVDSAEKESMAALLAAHRRAYSTLIDAADEAIKAIKQTHTDPYVNDRMYRLANAIKAAKADCSTSSMLGPKYAAPVADKTPERVLPSVNQVLMALHRIHGSVSIGPISERRWMFISPWLNASGRTQEAALFDAVESTVTRPNDFWKYPDEEALAPLMDLLVQMKAAGWAPGTSVRKV